MASLKYIALVALLFSLSLAVFADTSNDATHAKDEVKPSEAIDAIDPQQRGRPKAEAKAEAKAETETDVGVVEPQIRWRGGGCKYGCCGAKHFGRCRFCCKHPQATEAVEAEAVEANVVEKKKKKDEPKP